MFSAAGGFWGEGAGRIDVWEACNIMFLVKKLGGGLNLDM